MEYNKQYESFKIRFQNNFLFKCLKYDFAFHN